MAAATPPPTARPSAEGWCLAGAIGCGLAGLCALALLVTAFAAGWLLQRRPGAPAAPPTPTPQVFQDFAATAAARLPDTATAVAPTAIAQAAWPLAFADTFDGQGYGWPTGRWDDDYALTSYGIDEGRYRWSIQPQTERGAWQWALTGFETDAALHAAVDARRLVGAPEATAYGIAFGVVDSDHYACFLVSDAGRFAIYLADPDRAASRRQWVETPWVRPGEFNRLALSVEDGVLLAYLNGQLAARLDDFPLPAGQVGLMVTVDEKAITAFEFDNFELRTP